jgi:hypothetical protein
LEEIVVFKPLVVVALNRKSFWTSVERMADGFTGANSPRVLRSGEVQRKVANSSSKRANTPSNGVQLKRCILTLEKSRFTWRDRGALKLGHAFYLSQVVSVFMVADDSGSGCSFEIQVANKKNEPTRITHTLEFTTKSKEETQAWIVAFHDAQFRYKSGGVSSQNGSHASVGSLRDEKEHLFESEEKLDAYSGGGGSGPSSARKPKSLPRSASLGKVLSAQDVEEKLTLHLHSATTMRRMVSDEAKDSNSILSSPNISAGKKSNRRWSYAGELRFAHAEKGVFLTRSPCAISSFRLRLWDRITYSQGLSMRQRHRLFSSMFLVHDDAELLKLLIEYMDAKSSELKTFGPTANMNISLSDSEQWKMRIELCEFLLEQNKSALIQSTSCYFSSTPFVFIEEIGEEVISALDELTAILQALCVRLVWNLYLLDAGILNVSPPLSRETKSDGDDMFSDISTVGFMSQNVMFQLAQFVEVNFNPEGKSILQQDVLIETLFRILIDFFSDSKSAAGSRLNTDSEHEDGLDTGSSMRSTSGSRDKLDRGEAKDTKERKRDLRRYKDDRGKSTFQSKLKFHKRSASQPRTSIHRRMMTSSALDARIVKHSLGSLAFLGSNIVFPEAWKACFTALHRPDIDQMLVNESLKNITALVIGSWKNVCSLIQFEEVWSSWVVPLCLPPVAPPAKPDDDFLLKVRQDNQSLSLKLLSNVLQQCFSQTSKFSEILRSMMRNFAHYGITHDCAGTSLAAANQILETLSKRLSSSLPHVNIPNGCIASVVWNNFLFFLSIVREFTLNSALWISSSANKSLRMLNTFDKTARFQSKPSRKLFSKDTSTMTSITDESIGLHLELNAQTREYKCVDVQLIENVLNLVQCTVVGLDTGKFSSEQSVAAEEELAFFESLQLFVQQAVSNVNVAGSNMTLSKKLLAARGSVKNTSMFRNDLASVVQSVSRPHKSADPLEQKELDLRDLKTIREILLTQIEVKEHKYMYQTFADCATGAEVVKGLLNSRIAKDSREAVKIAISLLEKGYLVCISHPESPFSNNDNMLFRFADAPNAPTPPESPKAGRLRALSAQVSASSLKIGPHKGSLKVKHSLKIQRAGSSSNAVDSETLEAIQKKKKNMKVHISAENIDGQDD